MQQAKSAPISLKGRAIGAQIKYYSVMITLAKSHAHIKRYAQTARDAKSMQ